MTQSDFDFSRLNPEQRQAVETTDGPVLVLSGAGTGKTTVLTARLAYIIQTGKALPFQCLAVTFTNKAANEMQDRLAAMIGEDANRLWLGTFHRIGLRILRNHPEKVGLSSGFTVLDASDQERLLKQIMADERVDLKNTPPLSVLNQIQRLKDQGISFDKTEQAPFGTSPLVKRLYAMYQERLKTMNAVDFGDLLLYCLELFNAHPEVLKALRQQFKYILVDEYQDTNVAQYLWLRLLAAGHNNICCVGDDDQSIYSWRGAEIGNILRFEQDFPNAAVIRLESNYRSTAHILAGASGLIAHNRDRLGKTLHPAPGRESDMGEKISVTGVWNGDDEAEKICDRIEREQRRGTSLSNMAVLVRATAQMRAIEDNLLQYGISYKVIGGMRFYEREEIRDATAYIRLLGQKKDDMAFTRVVNKPRRGVGDTALQNLREYAREHRLSLYESAEELLARNAIRGTAKTGLEKLFALYDEWRAKSADTPCDEMLRLMLEQSGYMDMRRADKTPESQGRIENLQELTGEFKTKYENFDQYLEYVSLVMDNDATALTGEHISVMTLHAAKGLEFDTVFLPGWEEGIFPNKKSLDENGGKALEEERRLAYVGITRARKRVYISFAGSRFMYGSYQNNLPSRFIDEIPNENKEITTISNGYGDSYGYGNAGGYGRSSGSGRFGFDGYDAVDDDYDGYNRKSRYGGYNKDYTNSGYFYKKEKRTSCFGAVNKPVFPVGTAVYHERYGYGQVIAANGSSTEVVFEDGTTKKIMADYLDKA